VIGLHPVLDQSVVRAYAESVADLRAARAEWEATGASLTVQRPSGPRESPYVPLIRALAGDVAKFAGLIGLTPKARLALGLELGAVVEAPKRGSGRDPAAHYFDD
jgi:phage terminase small subunit